MSDAPGGQAPSPGRWQQWTDRGREVARVVGPRLWAALRTLWAGLLPLLKKLWAAADGDVLADPPDEGLRLEHRERYSPIGVAAKGNVFSFTFRPVLTWSATGLRHEALAWCAGHFRPAVIQRLRRIAADRARDIAPHRADDLAVALQAALDEEPPWRYEQAGMVVECRPEVWSVWHDDRVREALQPHWDRLVELECEYELYLTRARYAEELNRRWVALLDEVVDDPAGGEEAEAITEELTQARRHMAAEQRAAAEWSAELLRDRRRFDQIFEPFSAIPIVPQQAAGPAGDSSERAPKATSAEAAGPESGQDERR
ncbi:hypothetical protein AB0C02_28750 [Micromonospora sp. NPDC048999]|uniref:hypothetical protein n=1 Tax=Micromonospora sp. NPDC048999 TaxID=3155391 RepID=UPI0033D98380